MATLKSLTAIDDWMEQNEFKSVKSLRVVVQLASHKGAVKTKDFVEELKMNYSTVMYFAKNLSAKNLLEVDGTGYIAATQLGRETAQSYKQLKM